MEAVRKINDVYEQHVASGSADHPEWPANLRIKPVQVATGVWEVTWSFTGPDGRATFEYIHIDGKFGIRWRRIGGHAILKAP